MARQQPEIWVFRHGETEWSRIGRHTGRTDVPLTANGRLEATRLGLRLGNRRFSLVLTSPLARASETCRLAGYGEAARTTDDLLEWDYGSYEGRTAAEIREQTPGWQIWTDGVPGGETVEHVGQHGAVEQVALGGIFVQNVHGQLPQCSRDAPSGARAQPHAGVTPALR